LLEQLSNLSQHPDNHRIYAPTDLEELEKSLKDFGQMEPIAITPNLRIISGHRRYMAMRNLGWEGCEVRLIEPENEIVALIEHNNHRNKTSTDILNEVRYLKNELKEVVGRGRNARGREKKQGKRITMVMELSQRLGIGTTKLKQLLSISNYEPSLIEEIDRGEISVAKAYEKVRSKFIQGKNTNTPGKSFDMEFRKLLKEYQPTTNKIQSIMKGTFPYNFADVDNEDELYEKRSSLIEHLEHIKTLDSRQLMELQKEDELRNTEYSADELNKLKELLIPSQEELEMIDDFEDVYAISVGDEIDKKNKGFFNYRTYKMLRQTIHSQEHFEGAGRHMSFIVVAMIKKIEKVKVLGIFSLHSDALILTARDNHIGWTSKQRGIKRECIVNMNTCCPTQPFGFNFLGGKFISLFARQVIPLWEQKYNQKVAAIITTSLHGSTSQYSGMKYWKYLGTTTGKTLIKPFAKYYSFWREWLKENYPEIMEEIKTQPSPKQKAISHILRLLNINQNDYYHSHRRGVYLYPLYSNYREYLTDEIEEKDLVKLEKSNYDETLKWWLKKSKDRYEKLREENRLQTESLFHMSLEKDKNSFNSNDKQQTLNTTT